jgi:hypothetical protein
MQGKLYPSIYDIGGSGLEEIERGQHEQQPLPRRHGLARTWHQLVERAFLAKQVRGTFFEQVNQVVSSLVMRLVEAAVSAANIEQKSGGENQMDVPASRRDADRSSTSGSAGSLAPGEKPGAGDRSQISETREG